MLSPMNDYLSEETYEKASLLSEQGYDIFNISSSFYFDICSSAYLNDSDLSMSVRINDIMPDNISFCLDGCTYKGVDLVNKRFICLCSWDFDNKEDMKAYGVLFKHKNSDVNIDFSDESKGTQMLFTFIPYLYEAVNDGAVLIVDELDKSLHPELVEMIVNIFNDKKINKGNAQLIFNTHDTGLLKQSLLRKDQIWFTEKDNETGISNLKLLADYKIKPTENYEKNYRTGVYGAIPDINNKINLSYVIGEETEFYK